MREKGTKNKNIRYRVSFKNMGTDKWEAIGDYKNYQDIADKLEYSYDMIRNIRNGRNKKLLKFIKIDDIINGEIIAKKVKN